MKFSLGKPEPLFIADDFYDENRRSCRLFLCLNTESMCFQRQKKNNFAGSAGD